MSLEETQRKVLRVLCVNSAQIEIADRVLALLEDHTRFSNLELDRIGYYSREDGTTGINGIKIKANIKKDFLDNIDYLNYLKKNNIHLGKPYINEKYYGIKDDGIIVEFLRPKP